jgi:hypothetical protein
MHASDLVLETKVFEFVFVQLELQNLFPWCSLASGLIALSTGMYYKSSSIESNYIANPTPIALLVSLGHRLMIVR